MRFSIPCRSRFRLALAVGHGAADFSRPPAQLLAYGAALLPVPGPACTAAFGAASVVHFAADLGLDGSLALHLAVLALAGSSYARAMALVLNFMAFWHVPRTAARLAAAGDLAGLAFAALLALASAARPRKPSFELGHKKQLVVVIHALLGML
jgi:hypothetical protein